MHHNILIYQPFMYDGIREVTRQGAYNIKHMCINILIIYGSVLLQTTILCRCLTGKVCNTT